MGEVHADAASDIGKLVEKASKLAYSSMGTATVNTMGQEILGNSAIKLGQAPQARAIETGLTASLRLILPQGQCAQAV